LLERDSFDLFLPEFDKPWVIHLRETCCCSTNLCTWRPNTVYRNRRVHRHQSPLPVVRQEHALQQGESMIHEFYPQSSGIWRQLDSLRSAVCGTCPVAGGLTWSFSESMSSCLGFVQSSSPDVLNCLIEAVFLSRWCFLISMLRRPASVVLARLELPLRSLLEHLLCWLLL
jgi:hypothetical protein